jgi:hypothetical protein
MKELIELIAIDGEQPLTEEKHRNRHNEGKYDLECDRKPPRKIVGSKGASVVNPVGDHGAKRNDTAFYTNKQSPVGCFTAFG